MSLSTKILILVGALVAVGALAFIIYNQINISKQQTAIQQQVIQQKALVDGLVQSANQYTTKSDLNNFIQQNTSDLKAIQDNLSSLGAQITSANVITANSQGQVAGNLPSTGTGAANPNPVSSTVVNCPNGGTVDCPNTDPYGYQKEQQNFTLNEVFPTVKVPVGTVSFSAWQPAPWSLNIPARQYKITNVIGTDENQRVYVDNKFTITEGTTSYTVPIKTDQTDQVFPSPKWYWWNPRLFLTTGGSIDLSHIGGEVNLGATIGIMSYGKFRTTPDISILQIGTGYQFVNKNASIILNPISVNVGHLFPGNLIDNTYVGPSLQIDWQKNVSAGINLNVGF